MIPQSKEIAFKKLDLEGLKTLVGWAKEEGWNPGPYDADAFYFTDPDGHYGLFKDDKMIGGGSIVSYNGEFGFMGLFIMLPAYRSAGLGKQLWFMRRDLLLKRLKPNASIGMDGVLAMQGFYAKGGFHIAFRDERYQLTGSEFQHHPSVSSFTNEDFTELVQFDLKCFGFNRNAFLSQWLKLPESKVFVHRSEGRFTGYAVLRQANIGFKIGPLFAEDAKVAEKLYQTCLSAVPGSLVYLDIPVSNRNAVELVKNHNASYVFECARMYYGKSPEIEMDKVYGITTFELG